MEQKNTEHDDTMFAGHPFYGNHKHKLYPGSHMKMDNPDNIDVPETLLITPEAYNLYLELQHMTMSHTIKYSTIKVYAIVDHDTAVKFYHFLSNSKTIF